MVSRLEKALVVLARWTSAGAHLLQTNGAGNVGKLSSCTAIMVISDCLGHVCSLSWVTVNSTSVRGAHLRTSLHTPAHPTAWHFHCFEPVPTLRHAVVGSLSRPHCRPQKHTYRTLSVTTALPCLLLIGVKRPGKQKNLLPRRVHAPTAAKVSRSEPWAQPSCVFASCSIIAGVSSMPDGGPLIAWSDI